MTHAIYSFANGEYRCLKCLANIYAIFNTLDYMLMLSSLTLYLCI